MKSPREISVSWDPVLQSAKGAQCSCRAGALLSGGLHKGASSTIVTAEHRSSAPSENLHQAVTSSVHTEGGGRGLVNPPIEVNLISGPKGDSGCPDCPTPTSTCHCHLKCLSTSYCFWRSMPAPVPVVQAIQSTILGAIIEKQELKVSLDFRNSAFALQ